jgi:hypothetical protein
VHIAEPMDGINKSVMLTPLLARHFQTKWKLRSVTHMSSSAGPKYGPNTKVRSCYDTIGKTSATLDPTICTWHHLGLAITRFVVKRSRSPGLDDATHLLWDEGWRTFYRLCHTLSQSTNKQIIDKYEVEAEERHALVVLGRTKGWT